MGAGWSHTYSDRLVIKGGDAKAWVQPTGYVETLVEIEPDVYVSTTGSGHQVRPSGSDWILYQPSGSRKIFAGSGNGLGRLEQIIAAEGLVTSLTYDSDNRLVTVTSPFGHKLLFSYDELREFVVSVTNPMGEIITYDYDDPTGNLVKVTYQDGSFREYLYDEQDFPNHLTGVRDESGTQYTTFDYDTKGRVILSEHVGGVGKVDLAYNESANTTTVTDAADNETVYEFSPKVNQWLWQFGDVNCDSLIECVELARQDDPEHTWNLVPGVVDNYLPPTAGGTEYRKVLSALVDGDGPEYQYTNDHARRPYTEIDANGIRTRYGYDAFHRTTVTESDQDTSGTYRRTTTYAYLEETSDLPVQVITPSVIGGGNTKAVTTTYHPGSRRVASITESGFDPAPPTTLLERTTMLLNYDADGIAGTTDDTQPGRIDGPRTDVSDWMDISYWNESSPGVACSTAGGGACGQIMTLTNAVGQVTTFDEYTADGRLKRMTDPNGLVTTYTYDLRGRLDTVTETPPTGAPRVMNYDYDAVGQLDKVTLPNGQYLDYVWTDAHLLDYVADNAGHRIDYEYDSRGNRTGENLKSAGGALRKSLQMVYDARNRLDALTDGARPAADLDFDAAGLLREETDSGGRTTSYDYDPLNRLKKIVDAGNGAGAPTLYGYNVHDDLISVQAPNGATTTFVYDDLGNLRKEVSPDRGTTLYGYDAAGNMTCKADGRHSGGATTCEASSQPWFYSYDAGNRVTALDYGSTSTAPDISFSWDTRPGSSQTQAGRLRQVAYTQGDITVTRRMDYDPWGNVTWSQQEIVDDAATRILTTSFAYDGNNQLMQITYPSGRVVDYTRNASGRITGITATFHGVTTPVLSGAQYAFTPFGPPTPFLFGNGLSRYHLRDLSYATDYLGLYHVPTLQEWDYVDYTLDDAGNVTAIEDGLNPGSSRSFAYDDLDRLTRDSGVSGAAPTYSYDGNGNRLARTATPGGLLSQTLTYTPGTNRLATFQEGGAGAFAVQHDGMGNVAAYRPGVLVGYDAGGRLTSVWDGAVATGAQTLYNGLGELARSRLWTPAPCDDTQLLLALEYFGFAPDGRVLALLSEKLWSTHTDYVWLDEQPVAQFMDSYDPAGVYQGTAVTYLHTDHLNTPRLGTDPTRTVTWRWQAEAFGSAVPTGTAIVRLRHPGQLDLGVGAVKYNYFRDYDPTIGRYLESDPIGLDGGLNTYGYVGQNPLRYSDVLGLDSFRCERNLRLGRVPIPRIGPLFHQFLCTDTPEGRVCRGLGPSSSEIFDTPGILEDDEFRADRCEMVADDNKCVDACLLSAFLRPIPNYSADLSRGENCQTYVGSALSECLAQCKVK